MTSIVLLAAIATMQVNSAPLPSHLTFLGRFEITNESTVPGRGIADAMAWVTLTPPETSTQRNVKFLGAVLLPVKGHSEATTEFAKGELTSNEGSVPTGLLVWRRSKSDTSLENGFTLRYSYESDLYHSGIPVSNGQDSGSGCLSETKKADFSSPEVQAFFPFAKGWPNPNDLTFDAHVLNRISSVPYSSAGNLPASQATRQASNCAGHTNLYVAAARLAGIPSRTLVGHLLSNRGVEVHVRAERLYRGNWLAVEPTNAKNIRSASDALPFLGVNGQGSQDFFTLYFGTNPTGSIKLKDGATIQFPGEHLQSSYISVAKGNLSLNARTSTWSVRRIN